MNKLQECIIDALRLLIKFDIDLIENQPKEECINHRFAQHLEKILLEMKSLTALTINVDVEYDKYKEHKKKSSDGKNIRPDIIAHKRKSGNQNNLVVIEAKKRYVSGEDKHKITDLVINEKFNYSLAWYLGSRKQLQLTRGRGNEKGFICAFSETGKALVHPARTLAWSRDRWQQD